MPKRVAAGMSAFGATNAAVCSAPSGLDARIGMMRTLSGGFGSVARGKASGGTGKLPVAAGSPTLVSVAACGTAVCAGGVAASRWRASIVVLGTAVVVTGLAGDGGDGVAQGEWVGDEAFA